MRHAREDYERFQDPLGLIPEDEPVMLFRGQDRYASRILRIYADLVNGDQGDPELIRRVRAHADRMDAWPKHKMPDLAKAPPHA